jgi:Zn finger protein HypA/HybF involved in hydrogenase expression
MAVSANCTNCNTTTEPFMDPKNDKVYCGDCEEEMQVSHFVKITMKSIKQFRQKQTISFGVKCQSCHKEARPVILDEKIVCPTCQNEHTHLSDSFKLMLKDRLKTAGKDLGS